MHGIISQAGGYAQIYSEPGLGTTFRALLPAAEGATEAEPVPTVRRSVAGGGETILLVEDEAAMREVSRRILSRAGYQVLAASDAEHALVVAGEHDGVIHLLLTDVIMPHLLGKELAEQVRDILPGIRVLFMSGYAQPLLASSGRLAAGVRLVEKPFSEATLLDAVRDVLDADTEG